MSGERDGEKDGGMERRMEGEKEAAGETDLAYTVGLMLGQWEKRNRVNQLLGAVKESCCLQPIFET